MNFVYANNVQDINSQQELDTELAKDLFVFAIFYASWCGHCKKLQPEIEKVAEEYEERIKLVAIDVFDHPNIGENYRIQGFPTIKLFKNGKVVSQYDGPRDADGMNKFLKRFLNISSNFIIKINGQEEFNAEISNKDFDFTLVFAFFSIKDYTKQRIYKEIDFLRIFYHEYEKKINFIEIDCEINTNKTIIVNEKNIADIQEDSPTLILFKNGSEYKRIDHENIEAEINKAFNIKKLSEVVAELIKSSTFVFAFFYIKEEHSSMKAKIQELSEKYQETIKFQFIEFDPSETKFFKDYRKIFEDYRLKFSSELILFKDGLEIRRVKKRYNDNIERIEAMLNNALISKEEEEELDPPEKELKESSIPVFAVFYMPWCGHCKKLAPIIDELSTKTKYKGKIKFLNIDCELYPDICDKYDIRGYPTIKLFKNGESFDYDEDRDIDVIESYLDKYLGIIQSDELG